MTTFYVLMPRWRLSLPPPAAPTSPSRSRRSSSSIAIESPLCRPLPSSCRRVVHHRQVAITLSIVIHHHCTCGLLPLRSRYSSSSIPVKSLSSIPSPSIVVESIAVEWPSRSPLPLSCRHIVHHRQVAIAVHCRQSVHCCPPVAVTPSNAIESIAVKSPTLCPLPSIAIHCPLPLSRRCIVHCCPRH